MVAEKLSQRLLMPRDSVALNQLQEVPRLILRQRRLGEMRIAGEEAVGRAMQVGEVAAAASGDEDFSPRLRIVLEQRNPPPALAGDRRAHQPRGARLPKRLHRTGAAHRAWARFRIDCGSRIFASCRASNQGAGNPSE